MTLEVVDKAQCQHSTQVDSVHRGYKPDSFSHTGVEDWDTDSQHTIEVLAKQHMDSAVECKHFLEVFYTPYGIKFEGNK